MAHRSKSKRQVNRLPTKRTLTIHWVEWEELPNGLGHGVEFHAGPEPKFASLLAFLDGDGWRNGTAESVAIFVRKPDEQYRRSYLQKVRKPIEMALRSGKLKHGPLAADLFAWFNA